MKLIIGLGNPGEKYAKTRHNVGYMVLDKLAQELRVTNYELWKIFQSLITSHNSIVLAKPQTMMNNSGQAVRKLVTHYKVKIPDLWVIHDDLDVALGKYKIQKGKGPRKHNGLLSIYDTLGTLPSLKASAGQAKDFWHVRVGVDNREKMENGKWKMENRVSGEDYVLQNFTDEEKEIVDEAIEKLVPELISRLY